MLDKATKICSYKRSIHCPLWFSPPISIVHTVSHFTYADYTCMSKVCHCKKNNMHVLVQRVLSWFSVCYPAGNVGYHEIMNECI